MDMTDTERVRRAAEVLMRARTFIQKGWCQETSARDAEGYATEPYNAEACEWCAMGAVHRAIGQPISADSESKAERLRFDALDLLRKAVGDAAGCGGIASWNDAEARTQEEVLDLFGKAIALGGEPAGELVSRRVF